MKKQHCCCRRERREERMLDGVREMGKFGGVFIGGNGNIGYNYNKCSQKNV